MRRYWMLWGVLAGGMCRGEVAYAPQGAAGGQPGAAAQRVEAPVDGVTRRDLNTLAVKLSGGAAGRELLLHDFLFNGEPVATNKLHLKLLSPGVVEVTSLAYSLGEWEFLVGDHADFYGMGEHFDTLNRAHTVVRNASQDNGGAKGTSTYKPMPFFMSTSGYGVWVDTTAEASFDFNTTKLDEVGVAVPTERFRVVLFLDPQFPKILEAFTKLTQRAILPPYWAFAPWVGRDFHRSEAEVQEDVEKTRALGLPASVILIDSPWATAYNSYKFNGKQFADPAGMVKRLHEQGYKLVLWHTPWIDSASSTPGEEGMAGKIEARSPNYDEAAAHGYFVKRPNGAPWVGHWWKGDGSLIDFTNPAAKLWWQEQLRGVMAAGADGFKDDDGEGSFQGDVRFADGTPRELMRNRYSVLYNNAVEEVIQKDRKGNGVLFARSVTAGANGLGMLWGGDNVSSFSPENGLPTVVTAGLSAGMSGLPLWTADLGGYTKTAGAPDGQVLARWLEFAAFSPVMEILSQTNLQPWDWDAHVAGGGSGTKLLDLYRRYAVLHMSLFPYRYAAAQEAAATGMPILRALPLLYQEDGTARSVKDEYLFGPELLVAPVTDANTRRVVYLPKGDWVDLWTGTTYAGERTLVVDAPTEVIPVFARAGAVLAEIPDDVMTLVPVAESGNKAVKTLDGRRIYEVVSATASGGATARDFEGREVKREGSTLTIGAPDEKTAVLPTQITVRWRFGKVAGATVDGKAVRVETQGKMSSISFVQEKSAQVVNWH